MRSENCASKLVGSLVKPPPFLGLLAPGLVDRGLMGSTGQGQSFEAMFSFYFVTDHGRNAATAPLISAQPVEWHSSSRAQTVLKANSAGDVKEGQKNRNGLGQIPSQTPSASRQRTGILSSMSLLSLPRVPPVGDAGKDGEQEQSQASPFSKFLCTLRQIRLRRGTVLEQVIKSPFSKFPCGPRQIKWRRGTVL